jgi:hypothetical protein
MRNKIKVLSVLTFLVAGFYTIVTADVSSNLYPISDGNYVQWTPKTGSTHYTMVDESTCNGTTDYNFTSTVGNRDSYSIDISSVPNGAKITQIDIKPCASRNSAGGSNPVMNVFYRLDSINSSDSGSYSLTGTTPVELSTTTFSSLDKFKTSTTTMEVGAVLTSGTKGSRLSRIRSYITYTPLLAPSNLTSTVSTTSPATIYLNWSDNSTIESNFLVERSTDALNWANISTTSANATSLTNSNLTPGTTYYYRVKASDIGGVSSYSNTASSTVP